MITLPGYQNLSLIYESNKSLVYRCTRESDQLSVIHKVLRVDYPTPEEQRRYQQEYEILSNLSLEGVIKVYDLQKYQNNLVLVLEDFGGKSLKKIIIEQKLNWLEVLNLGIKIVESLKQIHQCHIIHKDINSSNIIFNPKTQQLKIIDFGISTILKQENPILKNPDILEGTLAYISPEQTGRMNRSLDYRTDFYSLGITLYELLTQQVPFTSLDAMELVHCHIAKRPIPPCEINPEIPPAISELVIKLLAKSAEERYQSALGIQSDLEKIISQWQTQGKITQISLGEQDITDQFQIPQKLYGREHYIETLLTAFEQVSEGQTQMMLVSGYSGIGKSSLVQEIYKPLTRRQAYFICGKFDQLERNIPYSAIVNALQFLIEQLLTETEAQLNEWKEKLLLALGVNGKLITDVIPELELIIGHQPEIQELGRTESQNRFNLVFQKFIRVFCQRSHPLVIFLDDLQWADSATLNLVKLMMIDTETQYLFLIGAYRDNQVSGTHPLINTINELKKAEAILKTIHLVPLTIEHIIQILGDTLKKSPETVEPLAALIEQKTLGNPFFISEFLKYLYQEKMIQFHNNELSWQWSIEQIKTLDITDNVVELMLKKLKKLSKKTQEFLCFCACIGNHFDLKTLAVICEIPIPQIYSILSPAIQLGLIIPTSELENTDIEDIKAPLLIFNYRFLHDRVQQAAYSLVDQAQKKSIHLKIGRLLVSQMTQAEKNDQLFQFIDHLNMAGELITDEPEKIHLAKLNLKAGQKAKEATAYLASKTYFQIGIKLLPQSPWTQQYNLTFTLYKELAEVEFIVGDSQEAQVLAKITLEQAKTNLKKVEIHRLLITQYSLTGKPEKAIQEGRKALELLGIDLPDSNLLTVIQKERKKAIKNLGSRSISALIDQPAIQNNHKKMAAKLLVDIDPAAYFTDQNLYAVIVLKSVNLYLQYGNVPESAKGYSTYGILLGSDRGDYQGGYEFGLLALKISEKFHSLGQKSQACFVLGNFLHSWVNPIQATEAINNEGYLAAMESGDIPYAGYNLLFKQIHSFYQNLELNQLLKKVLTILDFLKKYKNEACNDGALGLQIVLLNLLGITESPWSFDSPELTEAQYLADCFSHNSLVWAAHFYIFKGQVLFLYEQPEDALKFLDEAEQYLSYSLGMLIIVEHHFYTALCLIALYPQGSLSQKQKYEEKLAKLQSKMQQWADNCPENFLHKVLLIEAEKAQIQGNIVPAIDYYEQAIELARINGFIQNEALAQELAGKFWMAQGKEKYAKVHLLEAHYLYQRWGAKYKVKNLEEKYSLLLAKTASSPVTETTDSSHSSSSTNSSSVLDLTTILKASHTLASEIVLDQLLASLMKILMENAGARRGLLLLNNQGELSIEASASVDLEQVIVRESIPINSYDNLPINIINYVQRTLSDLVLIDAKIDERFADNNYITSDQLKSVLCTPIVKQGKLIAILYLENNLTVGAFTPERLEVLKLLCSQAAISLENALLYNLMEQKVEERTQELNAKNIDLEQTLQELKQTQTQLIQTEKMSSLGQLVAGVAHEINNPVNFISGNLTHATEYFNQLSELLLLYQREYPQPNNTIENYIHEIELDFLTKDLRKLLSSMQLGAKRICEIVLTLRNFSRLDEAEMKPVDIHEGIESTLLILQHRFKDRQNYPSIKVIKNYGNLPLVNCYASQLNQVFMNIISNAIDALQESINPSNFPADPEIYISTEIIDLVNQNTPEKMVMIRIEDNGCGIPPEIQQRLFDPFFTTKPIGTGTGLGLSISYAIVVDKHGGQLTCNSLPGKRTEFTIKIPLISDGSSQENKPPLFSSK